MTVENTTTNRDYPLPDASNNLNVDVLRLIQALNAVDTDVNQLFTQVNLKAPNIHTHTIASVTGLQAALDEKLSAGSTISLGSLSDTDIVSPTSGMFLRYSGTKWSAVAFDASMIASGTINTARLPAYLSSTSLSSTYAPISHSHVIGSITGLQTALDGKAASSHTHTIANITNLQTTLDGKAAASHTHSIANVTGLQAELDSKAEASHSHAIADVTGLQSALNLRAPLASPSFTGTPTAPTPANSDNSTRIATTAFVAANAGAVLLGSVNTTGGAQTVTLSGVNLSAYKFVYAQLKAVDPVSLSLSNYTVAINGAPVYVGTAVFSALAIIDLTTGYTFATNGNAGVSTLRTTSTSISITTTGDFAGGAVTYYGVN